MQAKAQEKMQSKDQAAVAVAFGSGAGSPGRAAGVWPELRGVGCGSEIGELVGFSSPFWFVQGPNR